MDFAAKLQKNYICECIENEKVYCIGLFTKKARETNSRANHALRILILHASKLTS